MYGTAPCEIDDLKRTSFVREKDCVRDLCGGGFGLKVNAARGQMISGDGFAGQ